MNLWIVAVVLSLGFLLLLTVVGAVIVSLVIAHPDICAVMVIYGALTAAFAIYFKEHWLE